MDGEMIGKVHEACLFTGEAFLGFSHSSFKSLTSFCLSLFLSRLHPSVSACILFSHFPLIKSINLSCQTVLLELEHSRWKQESALRCSLPFVPWLCRERKERERQRESKRNRKRDLRRETHWETQGRKREGQRKRKTRWHYKWEDKREGEQREKEKKKTSRGMSAFSFFSFSSCSSSRITVWHDRFMLLIRGKLQNKIQAETEGCDLDKERETKGCKWFKWGGPCGGRRKAEIHSSEKRRKVSPVNRQASRTFLSRISVFSWPGSGGVDLVPVLRVRAHLPTSMDLKLNVPPWHSPKRVFS